MVWDGIPPDFNLLKTDAAILRLTLDLNDRPDITNVEVNGTGELLATIDLALATRMGAGDLQLVTFTLNKGVPEPAAAVLLLIGGFTMFRRQRG